MDVGRPKRLFVLVNPYGGKKSASKVYVDTVQPLLEDAGIQFTVQGLYISSFAYLNYASPVIETFNLYLCCVCFDVIVNRN